MQKETILSFEELITKKRGSTKKLHTLEENKEMVVYIIENILDLTEEEFRALYSTEFNGKYHLSKYIAQILALSTEDTLLGTKGSKGYIFYALYPGEEKLDTKKEIIRLLNSNDEATRKHLEKIKDLKKQNLIIYTYLEWLFDEVMNMSSQKERFRFLSKEEELGFAEKIPCFAIAKSKYFCLLDFYFYNLPKRAQYALYEDYLFYRKDVETGLDVIKYALQDKKHFLRILEQ